MKIKLNRRKILALGRTLTDVGHHKGVSFAIAISHNAHAIEPILEGIEKASKPSKKFEEYNRKRLDLCEKYSGHGVPRMIGGDFNFTPENRILFDMAHDELKGEYQEALDERNEQLRAVDESLDDEETFDGYAIKFVNLPTEISARELTGLFPLIVGSPKEDEDPAPEKVEKGKP